MYVMKISTRLITIQSALNLFPYKTLWELFCLLLGFMLVMTLFRFFILDDCKSTVICKTDLYLILDCFLVGLQDYTVDSCGDIGSYVRKASMCGLKVMNII